jgi:hypothetical protein
MKKILSSLFILLLLFVLLWGAAGWYFGANAHSELKQYLQHAASIPGEKLFRGEILDFKKTAFGAKARLRIHSDTLFLNEALGDIDINARLLNGPVFIDKNAPFDHLLNVGTTRWHLSIKQDALEPSQADILATLFPDQLPTATIVIDFENKAHYQIMLQSYFGKALIQGMYDLNSAENRGVVKLENVILNVLSFQIKMAQASIDFQHQENITAEFKPGTTHIAIPELLLTHAKLLQAIRLEINADTAIQTTSKHKQDFLTALVKMHITQKHTENKPAELPVDEADLRLQIDNLSINGLIAVSETRAELDNLRQQVQWTLEESGELPEGQDRIWQLNDQLQHRQDQLPVLISQKLFADEPADGVNKSEKSGVSLKITAGSSTLSAHLFPGTRLKNTSEYSLPQLLQGEADITLSNALFHTIKRQLNPSQKERFIKPVFKVRFRDGKIVFD